jgi:hypothetical protein
MKNGGVADAGDVLWCGAPAAHRDRDAASRLNGIRAGEVTVERRRAHKV